MRSRRPRSERWFALPGVTALMMGIDGRWSAIRITLESQLIGSR